MDSALESSDDSEYEQYSLDERQHYKTPKPLSQLKSILKPTESIIPKKRVDEDRSAFEETEKS